MKLTFSQLTLAATLTLATGAAAAPYCDDLNVSDQLPKKYQKRGPFYSDTATGWIIGQDQFKSEFTVTSEVSALWQDIAGEFKKHGADLVVLAAPPRPLFAPADAITAMNLPADAQLSDLQNGFSTYIAGLNAAGIVAPDLSRLAQSDTAEGYYFARDTHWTPMGAAISVSWLNEVMTQTPAAEVLATISTTQEYAEKGSLSTVVDATCGTRLSVENVPAPQYAQQGSAESLLGDTPAGKSIALVGTSFSDRYQRDAYQVAEAVSFVMGAPVDNFSVTGGGLVGAMEAFIHSDALQENDYQTIIWEAPYSAPLTQVDGLRQVLGALQAKGQNEHLAEVGTKISDTWVSVDQDFSAAQVTGLEIETDRADTGQLFVELIDNTGKKTRTKLVKTDRVSADLRSTRWAMSLKNMPTGDVSRIKLRLKGSVTQEPVTIRIVK